VLVTPWHSSAIRLAVAYRIILDRRCRLSKDGDAVRFVELALEKIGALQKRHRKGPAQGFIPVTG
jgi:hypothetical protein